MSRLDEIAARRAVLRDEIAASRDHASRAAGTLGREALLALGFSVVARLLTQRFRWGGIAGALIGLVATQVLRRGR
jgi:hypothetical protein